MVIDYGRAADHEDGKEPPAPVGHCAQVDSAATGAEVLSDVAQVRSKDSLVCAVDQVPTQGCGGEVKQVSAAAKALPASPAGSRVRGPGLYPAVRPSSAQSALIGVTWSR